MFGRIISVDHPRLLLCHDDTLHARRVNDCVTSMSVYAAAGAANVLTASAPAAMNMRRMRSLRQVVTGGGSGQ